MDTPKKILIIQTAFIGDVILATAVLEKLHHFFPQAQLDFFIRKGNESLFKGHPFLNEVLVWDKVTQKYRNLLKMISKVRLNRYDLVINLQRFLSTGIITALSEAKMRVGFDKNPLSFACHLVKQHRIDDGGHEVERNLSLIQDFTDNRFFMPKLYPSKEDYEKVKSDVPYVCMAPASVWYTKQWPAEKWRELIDELPPHLTVFLLGSQEDLPLCERMVKNARNPKVINEAGSLTLLQSAALMEKAEMNYVNDSAPLHLASAVNAPVTAIFCSTAPRFGFGPLSTHSKIVETKLDLDCRPCGLHGKKVCPQEHFRCSDIEIREVL